ncbi:M3 family oligoendopeptidase [Candidatus Bipolaricaulota bacterium]|nr:M3 family oligoendopeptidase [Candidatus Bipolaricaulota bacterium]
MTLDLSLLPREYPRRYLPEGLTFASWNDLEPFFRELEERELKTAAQAERWLQDLSELLSVASEERSVRYIRMTCDTANKEYERAYLQFVEEIEPKLKPVMQSLMKRLVESPAAGVLPEDRYAVLLRSFRNRVELFREENVPLEVEEEKLSQHYEKITGAMTVTINGKELTLQQAAKYLEDPDRGVRRDAWEKISERRLRDRDELDGLFDELLSLRQRIAANAGFKDYRAYAFRKRERFDYGPEDCLSFHAAVERQVVPVLVALQERRKAELGVKRLRPWDLDVDPSGKPPLRPFTKAEELVEGVAEIFRRLDPELGELFSILPRYGLLDLESRKGKAPGGYQETLEERRLPFIFMNAVGRHGDLRTLLHESGHAFHTLLSRREPLIFLRRSPLEFAEVASMSMELLTHPHWEVFYAPEDADRARRQHLEGIVMLLCWIATVDAFQHWLYTHPEHTQKERAKAWTELRRKFGGIVDWEGYEEALGWEWHRQLHIFLYPFYYIEYGIAQLGALGIWTQSLRDQKEALGNYKKALSLGGSKPLPELFRAAALDFDFGERAVSQASARLRDVLTRSWGS